MSCYMQRNTVENVENCYSLMPAVVSAWAAMIVCGIESTNAYH